MFLLIRPMWYCHKGLQRNTGFNHVDEGSRATSAEGRGISDGVHFHWPLRFFHLWSLSGHLSCCGFVGKNLLLYPSARRSQGTMMIGNDDTERKSLSQKSVQCLAITWNVLSSLAPAVACLSLDFWGWFWRALFLIHRYCGSREDSLWVESKSRSLERIGNFSSSDSLFVAECRSYGAIDNVPIYIYQWKCAAHRKCVFLTFLE